MLFTKHTLQNGLTVIHHPDFNTKLCVLNILYRVGSKDESPDKTGFAHLFEHLMFGGSKHVPDFDTVLQTAGGDNNAFTSNDITNYYLTLPFNNIETGLWLESDRMFSLNINQKSLDVQRNVVIEEFKERYLNQPYGDTWLKLLPLAYREHPYSWPTIGREISHIEDARLEDVKNFFDSFYAPNNAILVIAGHIEESSALALVTKWFGDIPARKVGSQPYKTEPVQSEPRHLEIKAPVPLDMVLKAWHMPGRMETGYYETDLLSDMLGSGKSSRLYQVLVKEEGLFSEIDCYITGDVEPGLFIIEGKLSKGIPIESGDKAIQELLQKVLSALNEEELQKVKNKTETTLLFNDVNVLNRAMKLAYCEMLGDINLANQETSHYLAVKLDDLIKTGRSLLTENNCSTLYYRSV